VHAKSGRRITYGEIAAFVRIPAEAPEVEVSPVASAQFRLVGKNVPRVDVPGKVNGTAQYSIDVHVPGMVYGAILREPMEGAAPEQIDDAAARAVEGVIRIVPLKYGVGVLANTPWAAFKAKNALKVAWSRNAKGRGFSTEQGYEQFAAAAKNAASKGIEWENKGDAAAAMAKAATVVEGEYRADYAYHAQMEPLNAVVRINDTLFLHGGISPKHARRPRREFNATVRRELADPERLLPGLATDTQGPLWYRGLAEGEPSELESHLRGVLRFHGVRRIVIGHTVTRTAILPRFESRVVNIDLGLSRFYGRPPACLVMEAASVYVIHRGTKISLPGAGKDELADYLKAVQAAEQQPSSSAA
jgi:hypothetical protein